MAKFLRSTSTALQIGLLQSFWERKRTGIVTLAWKYWTKCRSNRIILLIHLVSLRWCGDTYQNGTLVHCFACFWFFLRRPSYSAKRNALGRCPLPSTTFRGDKTSGPTHDQKGFQGPFCWARWALDQKNRRLQMSGPPTWTACSNISWWFITRCSCAHIPCLLV